MKTISGVTLLSLIAGLASLTEGAKPNKARMTNNADMAAIPNMAFLEHGVELTQRGPRGGWRAYPGNFGRGGRSTSGNVDVNANIAATITADIAVSATLASQLVCEEGRTICSPGYCADLEADADHCGGCGRECPEGSECQDGECVCPLQTVCERQGACLDYACGTSCLECPDDAECDSVAGRCVCPTDSPDYCEGDIQAGVLNYCTNLAIDADNCGECGNRCPTADLDLGFAVDSFCVRNQLDIGLPGNCECPTGYEFCPGFTLEGVVSIPGGGCRSLALGVTNTFFCGSCDLNCDPLIEICVFDALALDPLTAYSCAPIPLLD